LIGEYDSQIAAGQTRVLLAWDRLTLPDGRSIVLDRQPGAPMWPDTRAYRTA
jgi:type IV secretion system protein VirB10